MFHSFYLISQVISLAIYLVSAFAFYKLGRIRCINTPWLAFIPFFNLYVTGYIGDTLKYHSPQLNRYLYNVPLCYALPLLSLASNLAWRLPLIGGLAYSLCGLAVTVLSILVYYLVFLQYAYNRRILFTVLSVIPVVGPLLILYVLRGYHNY